MYLPMSLGGIALSVIAYMILGMFWYSPAFLGTQWKKIVDLDFDTIDKEKMIKIFGMSAFAAFITATVLNYLMVEFEVSSFSQALLFGGVAWLGFALPPVFVNNLYQKKPVLLTVIDSGYELASILAMSAIIFLLM